MDELVEVEAVAVPAHTHGSLIYRLWSKVSDQAEFMHPEVWLLSSDSILLVLWEREIWGAAAVAKKAETVISVMT
jgi:hypothetical protein